MKTNMNFTELSMVILLLLIGVMSGCRSDEPLGSDIHGVYDDNHLLKLSEFNNQPGLYQFEVCLKIKNQA
ncbi:MAG: hypothetical protein OXC40_03145, partial [Proteobacteria bacterium]|nr:hypothetical protein [Pseudomonadota bacterium]